MTEVEQQQQPQVKGVEKLEDDDEKQRPADIEAVSVLSQFFLY